MEIQYRNPSDMDNISSSGDVLVLTGDCKKYGKDFFQKCSEMYKQTYRSGERGQMIKTIALLKQLAERIPVYRMKCNISEQAVETSWNAMKPQ